MTPLDRKHVQSLIASEAWSEARAYLAKHEKADDVEWLVLRAEVQAGEGDLEGAAGEYESILERWPTHRAALYNASLVYSDLERHDDAMEVLESLIEAEGESAEVLNDLAYEYMEAGHNVPGFLAATRAEHLATDDPQRCRARLNAATSLANAGRRKDARAWLDKMRKECSGECDEREAADELLQTLDTPSGRPGSSAG